MGCFKFRPGSGAESLKRAQRLEESGVRHVTPTGCDSGHVDTARITWDKVCAWRTAGLGRLLVAAGGVAGRNCACLAPGAGLRGVGGWRSGPDC